MMLHEEIILALKKPNHVIQICQSFESSPRQKDYVTNLTKFLKFSPGICVALAYTLLQSQYRVFASDAYKILQTKVPELINCNGYNDLSDEIAQGLLQLIYANDVSLA